MPCRLRTVLCAALFAGGAAGAGAGCVSFRQTGGCSGTGPREPDGDRACDKEVPCKSGECPSGYCECAGGEHVHPVDCHPGSHSAFTCDAECGAADDLCARLPVGSAGVLTEGSSVALGNGYVCAEFDLATPRLYALRGDFAGKGQYGRNVLASGGAALEREDGDGTVHAGGGNASVAVTSNTSAAAAVRITGVRDAAGADAAVEETWTLALAAGARSVAVNISGRVTRAVSARAVRHAFYFEPTSVYALFDRGVVQMKGQDSKKGYYASADGLARLYALGGPGGEGNTAGNMSVSVRRDRTGGPGVVVRSSGKGVSSDPEPAGPWPGHETRLGAQGGASSSYTGFEEVVAGGLPTADEWSGGWGGVAAQQLAAGAAWESRLSIAPNNYDFPAQGPFGDVAAANIPAADLQAMLTGIYGSPVGQLCTHDNGVKKGERVGQMATTIARPGYGYSGNYNFFDPDNYISTSAMLFSGDPYLQEQVRVVIERNGAFINDKGQLPHHFRGVDPTYQALSGETQTGPNVFWILSALNYAKTSANLDWLRGYMPKLRNASAFLFDMVDPNFGLLNAPGSLMIDVFIRNHFTTDTNAMAVGFFREFADAEAAVGNATGAASLRALASSVSAAIDAMLWSNSSADHYVTQLNPDGSTRDFVDYDANYIALAHGVAPPARAKAVLARVDAGRCNQPGHSRASFVSEDYYGKHDTTSGNIGDSWCSMGRIGWFNALARKRYGDVSTFDANILDPLVGDVNRWTWLHERYHCDGSPETNRTAMYFEYPSVTAMMVAYVRYGIQLGYENVTVSPFGRSSFAYHVGNVGVDYGTTAGEVTVVVPGTGTKWVTVEGFLSAGEKYSWSAAGGALPAPWPRVACSQHDSGSGAADAAGAAAFRAPVGDGGGACAIRLTKA